MKDKYEYYYVACDAGLTGKEEYRNYFRLYKDKGDGRPILVEQGIGEIIMAWEKKYPDVQFNSINPYPQYD